MAASTLTQRAAWKALEAHYKQIHSRHLRNSVRR